MLKIRCDTFALSGPAVMHCSCCHSHWTVTDPAMVYFTTILMEGTMVMTDLVTHEVLHHCGKVIALDAYHAPRGTPETTLPRRGVFRRTRAR